MKDKIKKYISLLIFDFPFLIPAIKFKIDNCNEGLGKTDGSTIFINFEAAKKLPFEILYVLLLHEILHCFLFHPSRMKGRDFETWNYACDFVANGIIVEISKVHVKNLTLPEGALYDEKYTNWSAEKVYNDLKDRASDKKKNDSKSRGSSPSKNDGTINSDEALKQMERGGSAPSDLMLPPSDFSEDDFKQEVTHAFKNSTKQIGNLAGVCDRILGNIETSAFRWEKIFALLVKRVLYYGNGRSFAKPKPYGWLFGVALPGNIGTQKHNVVVVLDTSGSVSQAEMNRFIGELGKIMSLCSYVHVITCDCKVNEIVKIRNMKDILVKNKVNFRGGGGTNFEPALLAASKIPNDLVIYISDGIGKFGNRPRIQNLIWVLTEDVNVPFGKRILMEA